MLLDVGRFELFKNRNFLFEVYDFIVGFQEECIMPSKISNSEKMHHYFVHEFFVRRNSLISSVKIITYKPCHKVIEMLKY